jgi:hypothetical protein
LLVQITIKKERKKIRLKCYWIESYGLHPPKT